MCSHTVPNTSSLEVLRVVSHGFIGCHGVVHWSLRWRDETEVMPPVFLAWHRSFGPRSFTSTIFIIMAWWPLRNFCTRYWVGPRKSASNRPPHLLRPALLPGASWRHALYFLVIPLSTPACRRCVQAKHVKMWTYKTRKLTTAKYCFKFSENKWLSASS